MSTTNIISPVIDCAFSVAKLSGELMLKLLKIKSYFNVEDFFKTIELKNKKGVYPKQIKIYSSPRGYVYLISVPVGLSLSDFNKYKSALEIQLKYKTEIKERRGYIEIEVITKDIKIEKEYFSVEDFFKTLDFKNKISDYPKQVKIYSSPRGYVYLISVPTGLSLSDFNKYKGALEIQLQHKIEIKECKGHVEIEVITKELNSNIPYMLPIKGNNDSIKFPIGESIEEKIILDLKENPHSYIVGTTGSGKSVCTKSILTSISNLYTPSELELYLCDLKRVELNLFSKLKHTKKFVYTVEDTTEVIADLLDETNKRYDLFMNHNVTSIFEYNKLQGVKKLKYQILYVEEIVLLLEDKKKTAMKLLKQLIAISRASGCYVFLTTQRPSNDVIDNVVKANINNRIVFKCEDSKNSIVALDQEGAEELKGKGHGLIKRGSDVIEFQAFNISDEQVKEFTSKYIRGINKTYGNYKKYVNEIVDNEEENTLKTKKENELEDLSFLDKI